MRNMFCFPIDRSILTKADRVAEEMGTTTATLVRAFLTDLARNGRVPQIGIATADDGTWDQRQAMLESFYDAEKTW